MSSVPRAGRGELARHARAAARARGDFPLGYAFNSIWQQFDDLLLLKQPMIMVSRIETANVSHALTLGQVIPGGDDTNCAIFRHANGAVSAYVESWAIACPTSSIRF